MTVTLEVVTADANPTAAPHKISDVPGKDLANVTFTVDGVGPVRAWRLHEGGNAITQGNMTREMGTVCGLTRCGTTKPLAIPTPAEFVVNIDSDELDSEGANPMNLYVYNGEIFE